MVRSHAEGRAGIRRKGEAVTVTDPSQTTDPGSVVSTSRAASESSWLIGDRYRVLSLLGRGGMADVFRAQDEALQRAVAVKAFGQRTGMPDAERRSELEILTVAGLNHPNLVTVFDAGVDASDPVRPFPYLVMELVEGPTLSQRISDGALDPANVAEFGSQVAAALGYVHDRQIVHRDVKPANVLFATNDHGQHGPWTAKLTDFGIARLLGSVPLTMDGATVGTASYLSPEQARGEQLGAATDIYSLALVLLEALTGHRVYDGDALDVAIARLHRPPPIPTEFGPNWTRLLTAMTATNPVDRPSAQRVVADLRRIVAGHTDALHSPLDLLLGSSTEEPPATRMLATVPRAPGHSTATTNNRRRSRAGMAILAVVGLCAALVVALVAVATRSHPGRAPTEVPAAISPAVTAPTGPATTARTQVAPAGVAPVTVARTQTTRPAAPIATKPPRVASAAAPPAASKGTGNGNGKSKTHGHGSGRGTGHN